MSVVADLIRSEAIRQGVPADLALAVARRESSLNQSARGAAGEVGVFQLMPGTAGDLGVNPYDLGQNISGGVRYLREQFTRFGDWATALAAYNAGPGRATNPPSSTRGYVADILSDWGGAAPPQTATQGASTPLQVPQPLQSPAAAAADAAMAVGVALAVAALILWRR